jgi:hypothetical protein
LADLAPVYEAKTTQQLLVEFWTLADWPPYPQDFNLPDFSIKSILQVRSYADLATLHPSIAADWDRLAEEYICKTTCSFCRCH